MPFSLAKGIKYRLHGNKKIGIIIARQVLRILWGKETSLQEGGLCSVISLPSLQYCASNGNVHMINSGPFQKFYSLGEGQIRDRWRCLFLGKGGGLQRRRAVNCQTSVEVDTDKGVVVVRKF